MTTHLLDNILAAADPAEEVVVRRDPDALLSEILRDEPVTASKMQRARPVGARIALVAAVPAALVATPVLSGSDNAYGGWMAYPAALSTRQSSAVARRAGAGSRNPPPQASTRVVLSERRGDIGLALLTGRKGLLVACEQQLGGSGEPSGGSSETYPTQVPKPDQILSDGRLGILQGGRRAHLPGRIRKSRDGRHRCRRPHR